MDHGFSGQGFRALGSGGSKVWGGYSSRCVGLRDEGLSAKGTEWSRVQGSGASGF